MSRVFGWSRHANALVIAGVVGILTFASCGNEGSPPEGGADAVQDTDVAIQSFAFVPRHIEIDSGASVTLTNRDAILHTVTSGRGQRQGVPGVSKDKAARPSVLFDQEMDGKGSTFRFTFEDRGEFKYFCAIHPGMTGVVVVN
jgi:plastocyanin